MGLLQKLSKGCNGRLGSLIGVIIICILICVSVFHFFLFNIEMDILKQRLEDNHRDHLEEQWRVIETILIDTDQIAKATSSDIADRITKQIHDEYPDMNVLEEEFNSNSEISSDKFNNILVSNINHKFLLNLSNYDNSIIILSRNQILADLDPSKNKGLGHSLSADKMIYGANSELYKEAISALFDKSNKRIIFYEPHKSLNSEHTLITTMDIHLLKDVFMKEGIDGLHTYVFLSPAYITEHGDVFGKPDFDKNGFTNNHKLIIVQKFNLVDVIEKLHPNIINMITKDEVATANVIKNEMTFNAMSYLAIACINVFSLLCMIFFLSYLNRKPRVIKNSTNIDEQANDEH